METVNPAGFCTNTSKNGPILRTERNVSCNRALVEVIENVPVYESYRLRAIAASENHEAVHQRPLPVSHAHSRHAGRELVLLAVLGQCRRELALAECARPRCTLHASFTRWRCGGGDAKSSVRSAMFIATRAARSAKLRRSGMYSRSLGHCRRSVGAKIPIHAAPTELGRASGVVVTINMALLTELDPSPSPKMRVRGSEDGRTPLTSPQAVIDPRPGPGHEPSPPTP